MSDSCLSIVEVVHLIVRCPMTRPDLSGTTVAGAWSGQFMKRRVEIILE